MFGADSIHATNCSKLTEIKINLISLDVKEMKLAYLVQKSFGCTS